jgi:hypothetical protein
MASVLMSAPCLRTTRMAPAITKLPQPGIAPSVSRKMAVPSVIPKTLSGKWSTYLPISERSGS